MFKLPSIRPEANRRRQRIRGQTETVCVHQDHWVQVTQPGRIRARTRLPDQPTPWDVIEQRLDAAHRRRNIRPLPWVQMVIRVDQERTRLDTGQWSAPQPVTVVLQTFGAQSARHRVVSRFAGVVESADMPPDPRSDIWVTAF